MTFKKAKLFRFKKDQNERITCISYDDNEEYYSFLREYRSKGYRQVIITTEIMIKIIETSVVDKFTSRLTATITSYNTNVANCENLSICFDRHDLAEAKMNVEIDGLKKHFKNTELVIYKPVFAEIQIDNSSELVITESDCLRIKLDKLFNQQNYVKCKQTFKFSLIQDPVDGDTYFDIIPKLENKKLNLIYRHNKATIKAVAK